MVADLSVNDLKVDAASFLRHTVKMDDIEDRAVLLFREIWPKGMPERDRVIWDGLLPDARRTALDRLEAVWRAECGQPWKPLAQGIGLGRSAFFNLRKLWSEHSFEGVVPNARRKPRRVDAPIDALNRELARELITSHDVGTRNVDLARILVASEEAESFGGEVEQSRLQTAERLIRHERRALATDPAWLNRNWGRRLLIDLTAISVVIKGEAELAVAAVCMDVASGLVLGSALGRLATSVETERAAVDEAWRFIRKQRADRDTRDWPPCDLDLMLPKEDDDKVKGRAELTESVGELAIRLPGSYSFGSELVQLIGPRLGRIPFAPRRTLAIDINDFAMSRRVVEVDAQTANKFWLREVMRHNEPIMRALRVSGAWKDGCDDGRLAATFNAVDGLLLSLPK